MQQPVGVLGVVAQEEHVVIQVGVVVHVGVGVVHDGVQQLPVAVLVGWDWEDREGECEAGKVSDTLKRLGETRGWFQQ